MHLQTNRADEIFWIKVHNKSTLTLRNKIFTKQIMKVYSIELTCAHFVIFYDSKNCKNIIEYKII